jgi:hypothetical protein
MAGEVASATVLLFDTLGAARVFAGKDSEAADVPPAPVRFCPASTTYRPTTRFG